MSHIRYDWADAMLPWIIPIVVVLLGLSLIGTVFALIAVRMHRHH